MNWQKEQGRRAVVGSKFKVLRSKLGDCGLQLSVRRLAVAEGSLAALREERMRPITYRTYMAQGIRGEPRT